MGSGKIGGKYSNSTNKSFIGKSVTELPTTSQDVENTFSDLKLTTAQKRSLACLFRDVIKYDKGFDITEGPYEIENISVRQPFINEEFGSKGFKNTVQLSLITSPIIDNLMIKNMDTQYRTAFMGPRGGLYTVNTEGKKIRIDLNKFTIGFGTGTTL